MIDFRHETFLALCEINNYTKTAESLHITQPAVTQHIKYLEAFYGCKLFIYQNKKLTLTKQGEQLNEYLTHLVADNNHFIKNIENNLLEEDITFGATLSIGEYLMPPILTKLIRENPLLNIHMTVGNTQILLENLRQGKIDFAVVEGVFEKSAYCSSLFSLEKFIPVCSPNSVYAKKTVSLEEITHAPLVLRERGSGTREIFENILKQYNYSLDSFKRITEIGNMAAIKKLVADDIGITFLFEIAAREALENGSLAVIDIPELDIMREFNFVFLKNSFFQDKYMKYFHLMKAVMSIDDESGVF